MKKLLLSSIILFWGFYALQAQCLSGHYTIGGVQPDFLNIQLAIDAIVSNGGCDSVWFDIRPGTYQEQIVAKNNGVFPWPVVILQPDPAIPGTVRYAWPVGSGAPDSNFVVKLEAPNYAFRDLIFEQIAPANGDYARVVEVEKGNYSHFSGCHFSGKTFAGLPIDTAATALIATLSFNQLSHAGFSNCQFQGGSWAFWLPDGSAGTLQVSGSDFQQQAMGGIYARETGAFEIRQNHFDLGLDASAWAIYLNAVTAPLAISQNYIKTTGNGVWVEQSLLNTSSQYAIAHNFLITPNGQAAHITGGSNLSFIFNSIRAKYGLEAGDFFDLGNGGTNGQIPIVAANIFDIEQWPALRLLTQFEVNKGVFQSNCYVPKAGQTALVEQVDQQKTWNFAAWQAGDREHYSLFQPVAFVSPTDLHLATPDQDLNGRAIGFSIYVNEFNDIDKEPLPVGWPDIGADQIALPVADGSLSAVNTDEVQPCDSPFPLRFVLRNSGEKPLTAARISWTLDGQAQSDYNWTGLLAIDAKDTLTLGVVPFLVNKGYVAEAQLLEINGADDLYKASNNASIVSETQMLGDYTIGAGGYFNDLYEAQNALLQRGICGNIRLLLLPGEHVGHVSLDASPSFGPGKTLEIMPADGVLGSAVWKGDFGANLQLHSVGDVFIHDIEFKSVNASCIDLFNVQRVRMEHCVLDGRSNNSTTLNVGNADSLLVRNCRILYPSWGVYVYQSQGIVFSGNDLQIGGAPNVIPKALRLQDSHDVLLSKNNLEGSAALNNCRHFDLRHNELYIRSSQSLYEDLLAIVFCDSGRVANNFISSFYLPYGGLVALNESTEIDFIHNSLHHHGSATSLNIQQTLQFVAPGNLRVFDNIIINRGGAGPALILSANDPSILAANYNDYWSDGLNLIIQPGADPFTTLAEWQAFSGQDAQSVSVLPGFNGDNDLRIEGDHPELSGGQFIPGLSERDIDGDLRNPGATDLGADQFNGLQTDVQIEASNKPEPGCHSLPAVWTKLRNNGPDTLHHVLLQWEINGDTTLTPFLWRGSLAAGEVSDWLYLGDFTKFNYLSNDLTITATANRDTDTLNNVYSVQQFTNRYGGAYTVGGGSADFKSFAAAAEALDSGGVCASVQLALRAGAQSDITLGRIRGLSPLQTLTIEPESAGLQAITIPSLFMDSLQHATFKRLAFGEARLLQPNADLTFSDCRFTGNFLDWSNGDDGLNFSNCRFADANLYIRGNDLSADRNVLIENCDFGRQAAEPSEGFGDFVANYIQHFTLINCRFERSANPELSQVNGQVRIEGNVFASTPGLYLGDCSGTVDTPFLLLNNFFRYKGQAPNSPYFPNEGVQLNILSDQHLDILHNSFLFEPEAWAGQSGAEAVSLNVSSGIRFENNLVKTAGPGKAFYIGSNFADLHIDHNNYELASGFLQTQWDFDFWRSFTQFDSNSTLLPVRLVAENDPTGLSADLHLDSLSPNIPLTTHILAAVPLDFDGQPRGSLTTVMGADEPGIIPLAGLVWPGDCNHDYQVSTLDWLHLGVAIGQNLSGPARPDLSITWSPKYADDWPDSIQQVNAKHADTNGDGLISTADTTAIALNYSNAHSLLGMPPALLHNDIVLSLQLPAGPYQQGQNIAVPVLLADMATNLYGVAFDLKFSKYALAPGSFWVDFNGSWLGQGGAGAMGFYRNAPVNDYFPVALVRTDGQDAEGFGQIATLHFEVGALADSVKISIAGVRGIVADGTVKPITSADPATVAVLVATGEPEKAIALQVFPNPTTGRLNLLTDGAPGLAEVFDALGRLVLVQDIQEQHSVLDLSGHRGGAYQLRLTSRKGVASKLIFVEQ